MTTTGPLDSYFTVIGNMAIVDGFMFLYYLGGCQAPDSQETSKVVLQLCAGQLAPDADPNTLRADIEVANHHAARDGMPSLGVLELSPISPMEVFGEDRVVIEVRKFIAEALLNGTPIGRSICITPYQPDGVIKSAPAAVALGPSIGHYNDRPIPSFLDMGGARFWYDGIYRAGMKVDPEHMRVTDGLLFDDRAAPVAPPAPRPR